MKQNGQTEWEPCSPGVLHEAALDNLETRRRIIKFIGGGAILAALGGTAAWSVAVSNRRVKNLPPGIACIQVHQNLIAYANDKIDDVELKSRITAHLFKCENCSTALDKLCCSSSSGCRSRPKRATLKPCATEHAPVPRP